MLPSLGGRLSKPLPSTTRPTLQLLVPQERLELSRLTALEPKSSASTNSATGANSISQSILYMLFYKQSTDLLAE